MKSRKFKWLLFGNVFLLLQNLIYGKKIVVQSREVQEKPILKFTVPTKYLPF